MKFRCTALSAGQVATAAVLFFMVCTVSFPGLAQSTAGRVLGIDRFGASGKASDVFPHFGFTADNIVKQVEELLKS